MDNPIQVLKPHLDGVWWTTEYNYRDRIIQLKSRAHHGMKAHCWYDGKVVFTQRFLFIEPEKLLIRMKNRIDMWIAGTWIPKKLRKNE